MDVRPVTLEGEVVRLEPLQPGHAADLLAAGADPSIWRYILSNPTRSPAAMDAWIAAALDAQAAGRELPFTIAERASGRILGATRYLNIVPRDRGLEIGWTWLTPSAQRTAVNTECKYLLLRHAFEALGAIRVQLKTDGRNLTSQRAIERLGALREGVLRKQAIHEDGYQRDAVMYSIIAEEWPAVRAALAAKLQQT